MRRLADERDAPVAEGDEVPGGQCPAGAVVDAHAGQAGVDVSISTVGNRAADQPVAFVADQWQRDDDQAVEDQAAWKFHQLCTGLRRRLDVVQDDLAAVWGQSGDDAADSLKRRLLVEERHQHSDEAAAFTLFSGGFRGRLIAELPRPTRAPSRESPR